MGAMMLGAKTLRARFTLAITLLLGLTTLNLAANAWTISQRGTAFAELERAIERHSILTELSAQIEDQYKRVKVASDLMGVETSSVSVQESTRIRHALGEMARRLDSLHRDAPDDVALAELQVHADSLLASWRRYYETSVSDPATAIAEIALRAEPVAEQLLGSELPAVILLTHLQVQRATAKVADADRLGFRVVWVLLLITGAASAVLAITLSRDFGRAIGTLKLGAERFGNGDLTHRVRVGECDELEEVAKQLNSMGDRVLAARSEAEARNTELQTTLERLKQAQQEVVQHEKLSSMGSMLAGLAHELNNPLAGILGLSECLDSELAEARDPEAKEIGSRLARPLVRESLRARDFVRNLLQFSRKSSSQLEDVDLSGAVDIALAVRRHAFVHVEASIKTNIPEGIVVHAEAQRLQHIVVNVINNALDVFADGPGHTLRISARRDGQWVELRFEDDGPGFSDASRVFDPFYTTKAVGCGTGLGLSLVHRFAQEFGGTVAAGVSEMGGACITIRLLPGRDRVKRAPAYVHNTPISTMAASRVGMARVLVVDDEAAIRDVQQRMLERAGLQVRSAANGAEAVEILQVENFDLVISDLRMPGTIDGRALISWLKTSQPWLAESALIVTGDVHGGDAEPALPVPSSRVLAKPFKRSEYLARVLAALEASPAVASA